MTIKYLIQGLILLIFCNVAGAQGVYKWTDENGRVHYGERPPSEVQAETVKTLNNNASEDAVRAFEERQRSLEESRLAREEQERAAAEHQMEAEQNTANCELARDNLKQLQTAIRVYHTDEEGNRVRTPEPERQARIEKAKSQIEEFCN